MSIARIEQERNTDDYENLNKSHGSRGRVRKEGRNGTQRNREKPEVTEKKRIEQENRRTGGPARGHNWVIYILVYREPVIS